MKKIVDIFYEVLGLHHPLTENGLKIDNAEHMIIEDKHKDVNIGQEALGYLKSKLKTDILEKIDILRLQNFIWKSWPNFNDFCICCSDASLWILEIDFNRLEKAPAIIRKIDPNFNLKLKRPPSDSNRPYGLTINLIDNQYVILIDSAAHKDELPILHEFTHFVQYVTGRLLAEADANNLSDKIKNFFGIDDSGVQYISHPFEFWTNIFNDLFTGLQKTYWLRFKNDISWEEYIDAHIASLKLNIPGYRKSSAYVFWRSDIKKRLWYIDLLACISYVDSKLFDKIVEKLKNK